MKPRLRAAAVVAACALAPTGWGAEALPPDGSGFPWTTLRREEASCVEQPLGLGWTCSVDHPARIRGIPCVPTFRFTERGLYAVQCVVEAPPCVLRRRLERKFGRPTVSANGILVWMRESPVALTLDGPLVTWVAQHLAPAVRLPSARDENE